jgi:hypothetical protein
MKNKCQFQWKPRPGQWILSIDFSEIKSKSVTQVLSLLEQMGYEPQLRYLETEQGVKLYALLKDEQYDPSQPIPDDHYEELMALYEAFQPEDMAIGSARGLPVKSPVAA